MLQASFEVNFADTPLVSIDGIGEFTLSTGTYHLEFGNDAKPLLDWGKRVKEWISAVRELDGGELLRHIAVSSRYRLGQFHDQGGWPRDKPRSLDALCVDETYRDITIDRPSLCEVVEKTENDATTSEAFMEKIKDIRRMVLVGVTTTTCIGLTVPKLFERMARGEIELQEIVIARDGFAARDSRKEDARRILDELAQSDRIIMVPNLNNVHWTIQS